MLLYRIPDGMKMDCHNYLGSEAIVEVICALGRASEMNVSNYLSSRCDFL